MYFARTEISLWESASKRSGNGINGLSGDMRLCVPACGRAGEPSGTTILVCDFGVPSLMVVSTRLRFSTGRGWETRGPLFLLPPEAQCRTRSDPRAIRRIPPIGAEILAFLDFSFRIDHFERSDFGWYIAIVICAWNWPSV